MIEKSSTKIEAELTPSFYSRDLRVAYSRHAARLLEPGGFGEMLGNDVSLVRHAIEPNRQLLAACGKPG